MAEDANETIEQLMKRFRVTTDQALADRLSLARSTVTSWRKRGSIPARYARLAEETPTLLPDFLNPTWSEEEKAAMRLALIRLIKGFGSQITDYPSYVSKVGFLPAQMATGIERALLDVMARMEKDGLDDPRQCADLIAYEEFFAVK